MEMMKSHDWHSSCVRKLEVIEKSAERVTLSDVTDTTHIYLTS